MDIGELDAFIVEAKSRTYVGGGTKQRACRPGSHDIAYQRDRWRYLGGTDFAGQEVVWLDNEPVWAMNYFGRIVIPDLIDAVAAGTVIKEALSKMYAEHGRFLGGMELQHRLGYYVDSSSGDCSHFTGQEFIEVKGERAYELDYRGGLIIP